jgi:hypothetical protein
MVNRERPWYRRRDRDHYRSMFRDDDDARINTERFENGGEKHGPILAIAREALKGSFRSLPRIAKRVRLVVCRQTAPCPQESSCS